MHELRQNVPKAWIWVEKEVQQILAELFPRDSRRLFELWKLIAQRRAERVSVLSGLDQLCLAADPLSSFESGARLSGLSFKSAIVV